MRKQLTAALAALSLSVSGAARASTLTVNPKRLIEVVDVIDGTIVGEAQKLDKLSTENQDPVYILLNSPGGMTVPGYSFADAMIAARARGTKLVCVTGVLAASMAFNLLAYCDERYALAHAKLLFHPVRISSRAGLTLDEMVTLAPQMRRLEERNRVSLIQMMGVTRAFFDRHYHAETLWEAEDLVSVSPNPWLTIVDDVQGVSNLFVIEKPRSLFQFMVPGISSGTQEPEKPTLKYRHKRTVHAPR